MQHLVPFLNELGWDFYNIRKLQCTIPEAQ